ncbi:MAG TPA: MraY family glycosyltransferase [Iamia sp.]|jgi:UDP-GlcNAc:undecaprenyl-phosphate GlcNAc-1-phosphate transferase|nr:MraY family glycosyltransferase [Iamia sp.]
MRPPAFAYGTAFAVAFGIALVLTPICGWLAKRIGAIDDKTDDRRVHISPTPYLGGVAMCLALVGGVAAAWRMGEFHAVFEDGVRTPLNGILLAAVIACAVGTWDDIREVSPPAKTAGLVLSGSALYWMGAALFIVRIPFAGTVVLSWDLVPLVTVIWAMGMANATNFIDGLDGLAAGIVAIASGALFLYAHRISDPALVLPVLSTDSPAPLIAIVVLGACVGFLPYNFNPARIFMGDGGALMLGVVMAGTTMLVGGQSDTPVSGRSYFFFLPLLIPVVVMGVPILDTMWAIVRRTRRGLSPAHADKNHLHHRLMRMGHGHRRSVLILWTWTALLSAFVLVPVYSRRGDSVVPIGIAAAGLVLYTYLHPGARRTRELEG